MEFYCDADSVINTEIKDSPTILLLASVCKSLKIVSKTIHTTLGPF